MPMLVSEADAQATVDAFRTNYQKLGSPRMLIYVNRDLVDEQSGLKLSGRSETVKTTSKTDLKLHQQFHHHRDGCQK